MPERWCDTCEHCVQEPQDWPGKWHCLKWPRLTGHRFVAQGKWTGATPYRRCGEINIHGDCPMWELKREEPK